MAELFRVGTPVWCERWGYGKVDSISTDPIKICPVVVKFDLYFEMRTFSLDGRYTSRERPVLTPVDFAPGDTVSFGGVEDIAKATKDRKRLRVLCYTFFMDGTFEDTPRHTTPSLRMIRRHDEPKLEPKPKFKVGQTVYISDPTNKYFRQEFIIDEIYDGLITAHYHEKHKNDLLSFVECRKPFVSISWDEKFLSADPPRPEPKFKNGDRVVCGRLKKKRTIKGQPKWDASSVCGGPSWEYQVYEAPNDRWHESNIEPDSPTVEQRLAALEDKITKLSNK